MMRQRFRHDAGGGKGGAAAIDRRRALALLGAAAALTASPLRAAASLPVVRIGVLQFGSVAWQLDVIAHHDLAGAERIAIETVTLASNQATLVALQAGRVDIIVSDLLWVARQRATGADWAFRPYSTALGAVIVPAGSPLRELGDLAGRKLGIAGSPLDKSWLLRRRLSRRQLGRDLDDAVEKAFGAPPLLAEQLLADRLDAVLTYWQFAAKLEAQGARRLLGMGDVMRALGIAEPVPLVGYTLSEGWARDHAELAAAFFRVCGHAEDILQRSDEEWRRIAPLTGAAGDAELARLRDAFRDGIPRGEERGIEAAASRLYDLLAEIGGEALVGPSRTLPQGTFLGRIGS